MNNEEVAMRRKLATEYAASMVAMIRTDHIRAGLLFEVGATPLTLCQVVAAAVKLHLDPAVWFVSP